MLKNLKNQISSRKKYNNTNASSALGNQNADGVKHSPLEIINEINADVSKESYYEGNTVANKLNKISESNEIKVPNASNFSEVSPNLMQQQGKNQILNIEAELKNNNSNIVNTNEYAFDNTAPNINNINENSRFNNNNNSKSINNSTINLMSNYNSENIDSQNNNQMMNSNNPSNIVREDIHRNYSSYQGYKSNQPMQNRNKKSQGAKEERWKNIKITSIVAERIILSNQEGNFLNIL